MDDYDKYRDDFLIACENGDFELMKTISEKCDGYFDFECPVTRENGLHKCARNRDAESCSNIVEYILHRWKVNIYHRKDVPSILITKPTCDYTPLMLATHFQNEIFVRKLVNGPFIDFKTSEEMRISDTNIYPPGSTALHIAILSGNIQIINLFLSAGVSFWIANQNGETALELAQKAKNAREIMPVLCSPTKNYAFTLVNSKIFPTKKMQLLKIFIDNGFDINKRGPNGFTLLFTATLRGWKDFVRFLISQGPNVNIQLSTTKLNRHHVGYKNNVSALHAAVEILHVDIIKMLLEAHADVDLQVGTRKLLFKHFQQRVPKIVTGSKSFFFINKHYKP